MVAVINNLLTPDFSIWNDDLLIIEGLQNGRKQWNLFHVTKFTRRVDEVTNFERAEHHKHDASGKIAQRALQSKADSQRRSTQHSDDGCRLNAKAAKDREDNKRHNDVAHNTGEKFK